MSVKPILSTVQLWIEMKHNTTVERASKRWFSPISYLQVGEDSTLLKIAKIAIFSFFTFFWFPVIDAFSAISELFASPKQESESPAVSSLDSEVPLSHEEMVQQYTQTVLLDRKFIDALQTEINTLNAAPGNSKATPTTIADLKQVPSSIVICFKVAGVHPSFYDSVLRNISATKFSLRKTAFDWIDAINKSGPCIDALKNALILETDKKSAVKKWATSGFPKEILAAFRSIGLIDKEDKKEVALLIAAKPGLVDFTRHDWILKIQIGLDTFKDAFTHKAIFPAFLLLAGLGIRHIGGEVGDVIPWVGNGITHSGSMLILSAVGIGIWQKQSSRIRSFVQRKITAIKTTWEHYIPHAMLQKIPDIASHSLMAMGALSLLTGVTRAHFGLSGAIPYILAGIGFGSYGRISSHLHWQTTLAHSFQWGSHALNKCSDAFAQAVDPAMQKMGTTSSTALKTIWKLAPYFLMVDGFFNRGAMSGYIYPLVTAIPYHFAGYVPGFQTVSHFAAALFGWLAPSPLRGVPAIGVGALWALKRWFVDETSAPTTVVARASSSSAVALPPIRNTSSSSSSSSRSVNLWGGR